jgi:hypothetical protein
MAVANLGSSCLNVVKSQVVSKALRQMKECGVFMHTYALQEVLARGLQSLRVRHHMTTTTPRERENNRCSTPTRTP